MLIPGKADIKAKKKKSISRDIKWGMSHYLKIQFTRTIMQF